MCQKLIMIISLSINYKINHFSINKKIIPRNLKKMI